MKTNSHSVRFLKESTLAKLFKVDKRLPKTQCQFAFEFFWMAFSTASAYSGVLILAASFVLWLNPVVLIDLLIQAGAGSESTLLVILSVFLLSMMLFFGATVLLMLVVLTVFAMAVIDIADTPSSLKRLYAKLCKPMVYENEQL